MAIIFDIDGLTTYPGFSDLVDRASTSHKIFFWTGNTIENAQLALHKSGLQGYDNFILDVRYAEYLAGCADPELSRDKSFTSIRQDLIDWGFPQADDPMILKDRAQKWLEVQRNNGGRFKYPPLLNDERHLLVESDMSYMMDGRLHEENRFRKSLKSIATDGGFSLILVPEHPYVFELGKKQYSPEQVLTLVHELVISWDGNHLIKDVGESIGMYEGNFSYGKEAR